MPWSGALPLLLLGVKCGFLGLHALNEVPESVRGLLVSYAGDKASVVLNLFVKFSALITHDPFPNLREPALGCLTRRPA
jgi:hypothetical protein